MGDAYYDRRRYDRVYDLSAYGAAHGTLLFIRERRSSTAAAELMLMIKAVKLTGCYTGKCLPLRLHVTEMPVSYQYAFRQHCLRHDPAPEIAPAIDGKQIYRGYGLHRTKSVYLLIGKGKACGLAEQGRFPLIKEDTVARLGLSVLIAVVKKMW